MLNWNRRKIGIHEVGIPKDINYLGITEEITNRIEVMIAGNNTQGSQNDCNHLNKKAPWPESTSELYQPRYRHLLVCLFVSANF
jgi:hypothetical protein